jgi:hypothetical protein
MPAFSDAARHSGAGVCKPPRNPREVGLNGAAPYGDYRPGEPIFRFVMEWYPPLETRSWACWPAWPLLRHPARGWHTISDSNAASRCISGPGASDMDAVLFDLPCDNA